MGQKEENWKGQRLTPCPMGTRWGQVNVKEDSGYLKSREHLCFSIV